MKATSAEAIAAMGWLKSLEEGKTEMAEQSIRSYLLVQAMLLDRFVSEYPDAPSAEKTKAVLERLKEVGITPSLSPAPGLPSPQ